MMRKTGCAFEYYHPTRSIRFDKINRRTHRRLLIVDGKVAFTGSVGFADEWLGNADAKEHWRDTQLRIEGPLVTALQGAFQSHWVRVRPEALSGTEDFPALERAGDVKAQLVASTSPPTPAAIPLVYAEAISSAEKTIHLANSYFVPDDNYVLLLAEAAKRGVDVQVMVPGEINDVPATKAGGRQRFGQLLQGGVKIFEYQPTMFHPKTMVVDSLFCLAGSSNFDSRSFQVNEELDIAVYDRAFAQRLESDFAEDLKKCRPYTIDDWNRRSFKERVMEWLARPFHSQL
jgi:cardiolipin synthase